MLSPVRRVTRASVKAEAKTVKFVDANSSLISDEGVDLSYTQTMPVTIPASIAVPQHPLTRSWTFWFHSGNKKASWSQNQVNVTNVNTAEDLWTIFNQIQPCSSLSVGQSYSMFKTGVLPDWEDKANKNGGRWMVSFNVAERDEMLDQRWVEVLIMMLGGRAGNIVTGAEVCIRKKLDRVELWVGNAREVKEVLEVGRKLKGAIGNGKAKLEFSFHCEDKKGVRKPHLMI